MGQITVKVVAVLHARPVDVYATIADYRHGHPSILPPAHLYNLQVEQGGYGAGTVIRVTSRVLGVERTFHHQVVEPEPGKILREQSIEDAAHEATTFTVTPVAQGTQSQVEIATILPSSSGFRGVVERIIVPLALAPIYRQELARLEQVAQQRAIQSPV